MVRNHPGSQAKSKTQEKISENKKSQKPAGDTPGDTLLESLLRRYVAGRIYAAVHGDPAVSGLVFHKHRSCAGPAWNAIAERKLLDIGRGHSCRDPASR